MLHELGRSIKEPYKGYGVINPDVMMIVRATQYQGACKRTLQKADEINLNVENIFPAGLAPLASHMQGKVQDVLMRLQGIIQENIAILGKMRASRKQLDVLNLHAMANGIEMARPRLAILADESSEDFLPAFLSKLGQLMAKGAQLLRPYQRSILQQVIDSAGDKKIKGIIDMATGTGKTYIEIFLALSGQLTHSKEPIIIVTPYTQLVQQMYEQYISLLRKLGLEKYCPYVIKVDSQGDAVAWSLLEMNSTLKDFPCVYIFCMDSYNFLLESENPYENSLVDSLKRPGMLILDESHLLPKKTLQLTTSTFSSLTNSFVVGLTATVKDRGFLNDFTINYSRERAVEEGFIAPCILDRFDREYSTENLLDVIQQMYKILKRVGPSGKRLIEEKGIIYLADNSGNTDYSVLLQKHLEAKGIKSSVQINSDSPAKTLIKRIAAFKASKEDSSGPNVALCKSMLKVGFDADIAWVVYLRNGDAHDVSQSVGRTVRLLDQPHKVAYIICWKNTNFQLIFPETDITTISPTADAKALERASQVYSTNRQAFITIPKGEVSALEETASSISEDTRDLSEVVEAQVNDFSSSASVATSVSASIDLLGAVSCEKRPAGKRPQLRLVSPCDGARGFLPMNKANHADSRGYSFFQDPRQNAMDETEDMPYECEELDDTRFKKKGRSGGG